MGELTTGSVPATESKIFKVKRRNDECEASGRLARLYFASAEQTPVALPRAPSFNKGRASRWSDIACTINMCHNAWDPPPSQAKRGELMGTAHSGKRVA